MLKESLLLTVFIAITHGSMFYSPGQCPEGREPGDEWSLPNKCSLCSCGVRGYSCSFCGSMGFPDNCYAEYDNSQSYPDCCMPEIVCEGDENFDASKLKN